RDLDLDYGQRRLRFVIDGVSGWYKAVGQAGYPTREQLDEVKARLWKAVLRLRDVMSGEKFEKDVGVHYGACFPVDVMRTFMEQLEFDPADYVTEHKKDLAALEAALRTFLRTELATFT